MVKNKSQKVLGGSSNICRIKGQKLLGGPFLLLENNSLMIQYKMCNKYI